MGSHAQTRRSRSITRTVVKLFDALADIHSTPGSLTASDVIAGGRKLGVKYPEGAGFAQQIRDSRKEIDTLSGSRANPCEKFVATVKLLSNWPNLRRTARMGIAFAANLAEEHHVCTCRENPPVVDLSVEVARAELALFPSY